MTPFDASFEYIDNKTRRNHGKPWLREELLQLRVLFHKGYSLQSICTVLERPAKGVMPKLVLLGLVTRQNSEYFVGDFTRPSQPTQENSMNDTKSTSYDSDSISAAKMPARLAHAPAPTPTIENKTFIAGADAANMSDSEIFSFIARKEREVEKLEEIKNKPKKLQALIDATKDDINKLVAYVDER